MHGITPKSVLEHLLFAVIGGVMFTLWGIYPILLLSAACFTFSAIMEIFIHIPHEKRPREVGVFQVVGERRSVGQERLRVLYELLVGLVLLNAHSVSYGSLKQLILSPAIVDTRTIFLVRFPFADLPWVGIPEFFKPFRVGCFRNGFRRSGRFTELDRGRSFLAGAFFALSLCVPSLPLNILVPLRLPFSPVVKTDTAIFNIEPAGIFHRTNDSFG